jgi:cell division protein ZapA (FtsZ GTPase activity inhibitor)
MKQTISVMGIVLHINTDNNDPQYLKDVARHVEEVAARIGSSVPNLPRERLAVMTALEIADELFRNASSVVPEGRRANARLEALTRKIEESLG